MKAHDSVLEELVKFAVNAASEIKPVFVDREEGGQRLADVLSRGNYPHPVVIAIPTGGIPVALPICDRLAAPLQFAFAKKISFSSDCRFGIGAVSESGNAMLNQELIEDLSLQEECIRVKIDNARGIMRSYVGELTNLVAPLTDLSGKTAILVDDGIATGFTILSAAKGIEAHKPSSILIASPIISESASKRIHDHGYEKITLLQSDARAFLIDNFYRSFPQLSTDDVRSLLPTA